MWDLIVSVPDHCLSFYFTVLCIYLAVSYIRKEAVYIGSDMSAPVLLNLLNELGKKIRCAAVPSILSVVPNELNDFNNTGARMQDSIYHMTQKNLFSILANFALKRFRL